MSSFAVICCPNEDVAVGGSMPAFESWLTSAFPQATVIGREGIGVRALEWTLGDYRTPAWMDGWINEDRTAIYVRGDPDLMAATAIALKDLFPPDKPVAYTEDWQGIPFDLRRVPGAQALADAVADSDVAFEWRAAGDLTDRQE